MLAEIDLIAGQMRDAATDPDAWPTALDSMNSFLGASGIVLLSVDERLKRAPSSSDLGELLDDYFGNKWYTQDVRDVCRPILDQKGVAIDYEFLDDEKLENCDFAHDFLLKHDRKWFAGIGGSLDGDLWCLAVQRSPGKGPFVSSDMPRLEAIHGCLAQTARYSLGLSNAWLSGAFNALELIGAAAMILDWSGNILDMNDAARSIVGTYVNRRGSVHLPNVKTSLVFDEIRRLSRNWRLRSSGGTTRTPIQIGVKTYRLVVKPLLGEAALIFSKAAALVQILPMPVDARRTLATRYGLTDAECRVAMALALGSDVNEIAKKSLVTENTVRSHLKAVYAKTETGSQSKLIALVNALKSS